MDIEIEITPHQAWYVATVCPEWIDPADAKAAFEKADADISVWRDVAAALNMTAAEIGSLTGEQVHYLADVCRYAVGPRPVRQSDASPYAIGMAKGGRSYWEAAARVLNRTLRSPDGGPTVAETHGFAP